jgi:hypothetical protein
MDLRAKTRVVHGALVALAVWPAMQICLVQRWDVSPWKLAGWGMYATPRFGLIGMEIYGRTTADAAWRQLDAPSAELRATAGAFLESHRWLRRLASERALVEPVRALEPEWREMRVVVSYPVLDRATARVVLVEDERRVALR